MRPEKWIGRGHAGLWGPQRQVAQQSGLKGGRSSTAASAVLSSLRDESSSFHPSMIPCPLPALAVSLARPSFRPLTSLEPLPLSQGVLCGGAHPTVSLVWCQGTALISLPSSKINALPAACRGKPVTHLWPPRPASVPGE